MNLTVAMKIIGGFAIISLLLIITSLISLNNLNNINTATSTQSELAIPTLSGSTELANELTKIGNLTLRAYYQTELSPLSNNLASYNELNSSFSNNLKKLKIIVKSEPSLLSNLNKVDEVYSTLQSDIDAVFESRKISIEQRALLIENVDLLEEKADDTTTLMLDLADHDLADTKLQRAVELGEQLETYLNAIVSSALEFRGLINLQSTEIVEKEINNSFKDVNRVIAEINTELTTNNVDDIADDVNSSIASLSNLLTSSQSIFNQKATQLSALNSATENLAAAEKDTQSVNAILAKQVELANQTTKSSSTLVADSVSEGNTLTIILMVISIGLAVVIAWFTLISITRPLSRVNEMLNIVSSGDLSKKLDESGKDEFAQLSRNCNLLIDSLRNLINGIVSRSTQLATAAEETSAVTAQSTTAIEEQRAQVEQAASATTEMSSTSQSVLSSANDALGEIKQADDEAERVKGISDRNRKTIEQLANEVEDASQVINKL
ncbi:MAG: methyl-accepting chemotaxis protein, partial [Thalassotalea sp.]|nr:methyl-accepting chemotaxis protein [Thalassotalea sp.]